MSGVSHNYPYVSLWSRASASVLSRGRWFESGSRSQRNLAQKPPSLRPRGFFVGCSGSALGLLGSASPSGLRCGRNENANLTANTAADPDELKLTIAGGLCVDPKTDYHLDAAIVALNQAPTPRLVRQADSPAEAEANDSHQHGTRSSPNAHP